VSHTGGVPVRIPPESAGNVHDRSIVDIYRNGDLFESLREPDRLKKEVRCLRVPPSMRREPIASVRDDGDPLESDPLCPYACPTDTTASYRRHSRTDSRGRPARRTPRIETETLPDSTDSDGGMCGSALIRKSGSSSRGVKLAD